MSANTINILLDRLVLSDNDCLEYRYSVTARGYSRAMVNGKQRPAHKILFEAQCGPLPEGKHLRHMCHNRLCCNLAHIRVVTAVEHAELHWTNVGALNRVKTHCNRGHSFTEENTRFTQDGRVCRVCDRNYRNDKNAIKRISKEYKSKPMTKAEALHIKSLLDGGMNRRAISCFLQIKYKRVFTALAFLEKYASTIEE